MQNISVINLHQNFFMHCKENQLWRYRSMQRLTNALHISPQYTCIRVSFEELYYKETPTQVVSRKIYEVLSAPFFTDHLWLLLFKISNKNNLQLSQWQNNLPIQRFCKRFVTNFVLAEIWSKHYQLFCWFAPLNNLAKSSIFFD